MILASIIYIIYCKGISKIETWQILERKKSISWFSLVCKLFQPGLCSIRALKNIYNSWVLLVLRNNVQVLSCI